MSRRLYVGFLVSLALSAGVVVAEENFDRLADADRVALQSRFEKEIWPLLLRGAKDGCVGCHQSGQVTTLKFSKDPAKDFRMLVKDGYFLKNDKGSLLSRVQDKAANRRMPPGKRTPWTQEEREILRAFTEAVDSKQRR